MKHWCNVTYVLINIHPSFNFGKGVCTGDRAGVTYFSSGATNAFEATKIQLQFISSICHKARRRKFKLDKMTYKEQMDL